MKVLLVLYRSITSTGGIAKPNSEQLPKYYGNTIYGIVFFSIYVLYTFDVSYKPNALIKFRMLLFVNESIYITLKYMYHSVMH